MVFYAFSFRQERLIEIGITLEEAYVLQWFLKFSQTNRMKFIQEGVERYYWISYTKLKEDLPLIIANKWKARRLLKSLCKKGVFKQTVKKNLTYFAIDQALIEYLLI